MRRGGEALARRVSRLAADALAAGGVRSDGGRRAIDAMDAALRDPRNLANPGTTADLTAATLFAALLAGGWHDAAEIRRSHDAAGEYRVSVTKDYLVFASAHFITFAGHRCEGLHGHNYRARVTIEGALNEEAWFVFDFVELKGIMKRLCDEIDHLVLLPLESDRVKVDRGRRDRSGQRRREATLHVSAARLRAAADSQHHRRDAGEAADDTPESGHRRGGVDAAYSDRDGSGGELRPDRGVSGDAVILAGGCEVARCRSNAAASRCKFATGRCKGSGGYFEDCLPF